MTENLDLDEKITNAARVSFVRPSGAGEGVPLRHCFQANIQTAPDGQKVCVGKTYIGTEVELHNKLKVFANKTTFATV